MIPQDLLIILAQVGVPLGTLGLGLALFSRSRIGGALIDRLQRGNEERGALRDLTEEVARLREEMTDMQERLDFAERALVNPPPRPQLRGSEAPTRDRKVSTPV